jgi:hypothetical protein
MTISDISRYPDPVHTVRRKLRTDGEPVRGKWDLGNMQIEGNEGGIVSGRAGGQASTTELGPAQS